MRVAAGGKLVKEVGELPLIEMLDRIIPEPTTSRLKVGIDDDAAVWQPRPGRQLVVTTDMLVERVDFRLDWTDWQSLGHKALAVNLSDIAAMGAVPRLAFVTLGLRGTERDRQVGDLYRGMIALARRHGTIIAGGDLSEAPTAVTISVTVVGEAPTDGRAAMRRSTARPGDVLSVTGPLGMAAAGLRVYEQDLRVLDGSPAMRDALDRPQPRVKEGRILARAGVRTAMDLSDGLLGDLPKMCDQSGVSAVLDEVQLPVPNAIKWAFPDWFDLALRGGEDFELLFAAPPDVFERARRAFLRAGLREPIRIGQILEAGSNGPEIKVRAPNGKLREIEPGAFSHWGPRRK